MQCLLQYGSGRGLNQAALMTFWKVGRTCGCARTRPEKSGCWLASIT